LIAESDAVAFSWSGTYALTGSNDGSVKMWQVKTGKLRATLASFTDGGWIVVAPDGRFDSNDLEGEVPIHWMVDDQPFTPLPVEIFTRQYYTPRLLPQILGDSNLPTLPSIADLNRVQRGVKIVSVEQGAQSDLASVTVEASPAQGQFQRDGKAVTMRTDA
jgi:hypothetical protein